MIRLKTLVDTAQAIFDVNRICIIKLLQSREMCVCELAEALNISQPRISQHLAVLRRAGIVKERREGKWIYYNLLPESIHNFNQAWVYIFEQPPESLKEMKAIIQRMSKVDFTKVKQQCATKAGQEGIENSLAMKEGEIKED